MMRGMLSATHCCSMGLSMSATASSSDRPGETAPMSAVGVRLLLGAEDDARSGSGDVEVEGVAVRDSRKGVMVGRVGAGGPRVHAATRSAAVEIEVGQ